MKLLEVIALLYHLHSQSSCHHHLQFAITTCTCPYSQVGENGGSNLGSSFTHIRSLLCMFLKSNKLQQPKFRTHGNSERRNVIQNELFLKGNSFLDCNILSILLQKELLSEMLQALFPIHISPSHLPFFLLHFIQHTIILELLLLQFTLCGATLQNKPETSISTEHRRLSGYTI